MMIINDEFQVTYDPGFLSYCPTIYLEGQNELSDGSQVSGPAFETVLPNRTQKYDHRTVRLSTYTCYCSSYSNLTNSMAQ
jgi:hypothetical protein